MALLGLFKPKRAHNTSETAANNGKTKRKSGRPTKEQQLERRIAELKLLEIEVKRKKLQQELAGNDQLTSSDIQKVVSYLGGLGFEIRPKEALAGDDLKGLIKTAVSALAPAVAGALAGLAQQGQTQAALPQLQITVPEAQAQQPQQQQQNNGKEEPMKPEPRLQPPGSELPPDVAVFAKLLIGRTPKEAAAIAMQMLPTGIRERLGDFSQLSDEQIVQAFKKLGDTNATLHPITVWLTSQPDWLVQMAREMQTLARR